MIGVIVGRFQVDELHAGHQYLIEYALERHERVIVVLGVPMVSGTRRDPLDYMTRAAMLRKAYRDRIEVLPLQDMPSDELWSRNLDNLLHTVAPSSKFWFYGGRESFESFYSGKHKNSFTEIRSAESDTGTSVRKHVASAHRDSADFRAGVIYGIHNSFPCVKACVDICLRNPKDDAILLGRKPGSRLWQFPGGMVDPTDASYGAAARRELLEETGMTIEGSLAYLGSFIVDDVRYRHAEEMKLGTVLYAGDYTFGTPVAGDDLEEVGWFSITKAFDYIVRSHFPLLECASDFFS